MKVITFILLLFFLIPSYAEDDWTKKITPEATLKAIQIFKNDPTGEYAEGALSIIVNYAKNSPDVIATLQSELFPFEFDKIEVKAQTIFLGSFIAGNIEPQILQKTKKDFPFEGVKLLLYTYTKLRDKNLFKKNKTFEEWIALLNKNELRKKLKT